MTCDRCGAWHTRKALFVLGGTYLVCLPCDREERAIHAEVVESIHLAALRKSP